MWVRAVHAKGGGGGGVLDNLCSSIEATRSTLVIQVPWVLNLSVGVQVADKANPCPEGSPAVWGVR